MDKQTLSNYGWVIITVLVLAVMIALATPFGTYVKEGAKSTLTGLFESSENALNTGLGEAGVTVNKAEFGETPTVDGGDTETTAKANDGKLEYGKNDPDLNPVCDLDEYDPEHSGPPCYSAHNVDYCASTWDENKIEWHADRYDSEHIENVILLETINGRPVASLGMEPVFYQLEFTGQTFYIPYTLEIPNGLFVECTGTLNVKIPCNISPDAICNSYGGDVVFNKEVYHIHNCSHN